MKRLMIGLMACAAMVSASAGYYSPLDDYTISHGQKVILQETRKIDTLEAYRISMELYGQSMENGIDFNFALALMRTESRFKKSALSPQGAIGLMQILPSTGKKISELYSIEYRDMWSIEDNISLGMAYIKHLKIRYGKYEYVAAGYNGGPVGAKKYMEYMEGKKRAESIHRETREYVPKVVDLWKKYQKMEIDYIFSSRS